MSGLKHTEACRDQNGHTLPAVSPRSPQTISFDGSVQATSAVGDSTNMVRLVSTQPCFVLFGSNPTATSSNGFYLPAGVPEYFKITPGYKIAAIKSSSAGSLYIAEC